MSTLIHVSTIITNSEGRILCVREAKPSNYGLWNLPGGKVEPGEHPTNAAIREVREETMLDVSLNSLVGVYSGISPNLQSLRFVFEADSYRGSPEAGDEILEIAWLTAEKILDKSDSELLGPKYLRTIVHDWQAGQRYPLDVLSEL